MAALGNAKELQQERGILKREAYDDEFMEAFCFCRCHR